MSVEIKIGSEIYGGWKTSRVQRGIEQIAGAFELTVSERWRGQDTPRQIKRGQRCEVLVDNETLITGFVDVARPSFGATSHDFAVSGRDATGDLVDCSAIHKTGQWAAATLDRIVRDICAPFGIKVKAITDVGRAFDTFALQEGETAFEAIERACRMRAILPVSDGRGGLLLTRAAKGSAVDTLVQGRAPLVSASGEFSLNDRHSKYIVKGQDRGSDDNFDSAETHSQVMAEAVDTGVGRYRPLIVLAENHGPNATYKQRADWERNVRRGRSSKIHATVQGWRYKGGLWQPNTMVRVESDWLGVHDDLLITSVEYIRDNQGTRTELQLASREAFDLIETAPKKGKKSDDWDF